MFSLIFILLLSLTKSQEIDWRTKGVINEAKSQGSCGACWAFAVVAAIESSVAINNGKLLLLSQQQLIDCVTNNQGCQGGTLENALYYIEQNGLCSSSYRYLGRADQCEPCQPIVKLVSFMRENNMLKALQRGPVIAGINGDILKTYKNGIINQSAICDIEVTHAVVVVGYKLEDGDAYWIVKNSWGPNWGERGYFRIMSGHNLCGIEMISISVNATQTGEPSDNNWLVSWLHIIIGVTVGGVMLSTILAFIYFYTKVCMLRAVQTAASNP